eukprot:170287-Chlamydomonas_euryale.AAC.1
MSAWMAASCSGLRSLKGLSMSTLPPTCAARQRAGCGVWEVRCGSSGVERGAPNTGLLRA